MTTPPRPTAQVTELFDPEIHKPPTGVQLLLVNPGGVLITGHWFSGCLAWGLYPKIPASVKARLGLRVFGDAEQG
jgi:hypothetical protein